LVAAPGGDVPLQIFEARYRVLFNTLLAGADDVDEGLVDEESPFKVRVAELCYSLTSEQPV
jgi:ATP-dependent Lon protease